MAHKALTTYKSAQLISKEDYEVETNVQFRSTTAPQTYQVSLHAQPLSLMSVSILQVDIITK